jgi:large repetitive protein
MKTIKTRINLFITICVFLFAALCIFSCDIPSSLGTRLNMDPPVVSIDKPDFLENIRGSFVITGTVTDNEEVVVLSVTIERITESGQAWKQEWESNRGMWQCRSGGGSWENKGTDGTTWSIIKGKSKVNVDWSMIVSMDGAPNGEYLITAGAENNVKTKGSLQQRRVVIDNDPPAVKILSPVFYFDDYDSNITYTYDNDVVPEFDTYQLKDPAVLDRLHNKSIKIQYKIEDNFSIDTLYFQLADNYGNIYFNPSGKYVQNLSWSGNVEIPGAEIIDPSDGHIVGVSGEKCYLQVISRASDKAGNVKIRSHGWLVYWPDADRPWVTGVGGDKPSDFIVYPGSDVQGQAYDNDGVNSVSYKIYNNVTGALIKEEVFINKPLVDGDPPTMFFSWKFNAPEDSDEYYIIIDCTDMYETAGYSVKRYFYVQSSSAPDVKVESPDAKVSLFGDINGKFTISGHTGNGEPSGPEKLTMVWLNPNDTSGSKFNYQSSEYSGWNNATSAGYTDSAGNIIWALTLNVPIQDPSTQRYNRKFSVDINLFTKLNIGTGTGKVPLTSQSFIFMAKGGNELTAIKSFSFTGDVKKPELDILKLKLESTVTTEYTAEELKDKSLPVLKVGDKITISGTWGDDSFDVWKDETKMVNPYVLWNTKTLPVTLNKDKTWKAEYTLAILDEAQIGSAHITASLADYGKNVIEKSITAKVETDVPVLMYITSDNQDGYYNAGKKIVIDLEFNKAVTFSGTPPTLTMNSGTSTAAVITTSGSQLIHKFEYTVGANENTNKNRLVVSKINYALCTGTGGNAVLSMDGRNLDKNKNIIIDTAPPAIKSVEALNGIENGTSYFKEGQDLYLLVKFNEDIIFTPSTPNNTSLTLNSSGTGTSPAVSGTDSLLFTYIVGSGQNISQLTASGLANVSTGVITDLAGNNLTGLTTIPAGQNIDNIKNKTIVIDTTAPAAPTFTPSSIAGTFTERTFTISGETGASIQYSVNGTGGPWINYPSGGVKLDSAGTYNVSARQTDLAGNVSSSTAAQQVIIKVNSPLLTSLGGTPGTYKTGQNIDIELHLRGNVTVSGTPRLALGGDGAVFSPSPAYAVYNSGSGSNKLIFRYTVKNDDKVDILKITSIDLNGAALTESGANVSTEFTGSDLSKNLDFYTTIKIDTTLPSFVSSSSGLSGTTLTLSFNKTIYKGTGDITIEHQASPRLAPAVLTKTEYLRYGGASVLGTYYTVGTNGTDASGNPDLTEKYILNYGTDTSNSALLTALGNNGAFKVTVPVASGAVSGSGTTSLKVDLSASYGYVLPVKGVSYTVTIPANLVQDSLSNLLASQSTLSVTNSGVNTPVIRIQKKSENILNSGTNTINVPAVAINETSQQITDPNSYWIKNADFVIQTSKPSSAGTWEQVNPFIVGTLNGQDRVFTGIRQSSKPSGRYIQGTKNEGAAVQAGYGRVHGTLNQSNTTATEFRTSWSTPGGYNNIDGNTAELWVNPYDNTITQWDEVWSNTGFLVGVEAQPKMWVNKDTSGALISNAASSPGTGYVLVGGSKTVYTVTAGTPTPGSASATSQLTAVQPFTTNVKIDCQTPNASITYSTANIETTPFAGPFNMGNHTRPSVTMPNNNTTTYSGAFQLGVTNNLNGYLYGIRAVSALSGTNSNPVYETASRSVIMFNNIAEANNWSTLEGKAGGGNTLHLWIRGGDDQDGSNVTPGFPITWSDKDYKGARLMTGARDGIKYWISWEVTVPLYFHFVAGTAYTTPNATQLTDIQNYGPLQWGWAKNAWSFQHKEYPLYPGGSLLLYRNTRVENPATDNFEFYDTFSGSR